MLSTQWNFVVMGEWILPSRVEMGRHKGHPLPLGGAV